jgi:SHAQKYF class myb-like DNA-binding protein
MYQHHQHQGKNIHSSSRNSIPPERHLFLQVGNGPGDSGLVLSTDAKPRLKWTPDLHERFIEAVNQLGGADSEYTKKVEKSNNKYNSEFSILKRCSLYFRGHSKNSYETYGNSWTYLVSPKESSSGKPFDIIYLIIKGIYLPPTSSCFYKLLNRIKAL